MFLEQCLFSIFIFRQSKYVLLALLLLSVEAATFSCAQIPNLSFKSLNSQNGLLGDANAFLFKDSRGFTWISSMQGLNRFDGRTVKTYVYDTSKPHTLRGNIIQSRFFEDKKGDIWFCTDEAINVYRRQRDNFDSYYLHDAKGNTLQNDYYIFHLDVSGWLWLRMGNYKSGKLYRFNTIANADGKAIAELHEEKHAEEQHHDFIGLRTVVETTQNGRVKGLLSFFWGGILGIKEYKYNDELQLKEEVYYFSGQKNDVFSPKDTFSIKQVLFDSTDNVYWLATQRGLVSWNKDERRYTLYNIFNGRKVTALTDIVIFKHYILASSKSDGVLVFDKNLGKFSQQILPKYAEIEGGQIKTIDYLFLDAENTIWLSNLDRGLFYTNLQRPKFSFLKPSALSPNVLTDNIIEDAQNNKWVVKRGTSIDVYNKQRQIVSQFFPNIFSDFIKRLYHDSEGGIWALTAGRLPLLHRFNPQKRTFEAIKFAENQQTGDVIQLYDVHQISDGRLLIGSSKGVFEFDKYAKNSLVKKCPIIGIDTTKWDAIDIFEDKYKTVFINHKNQSLLMCRREGKNIRKIKEIPINGETVGFVEQDNRLWLATTKGLLAFAHDFEQLTRQSTHLFGLHIDAILPDSTGHFWLTTSEGIINFDPKSGNYHRYTTADGMQGYNFGRSALADKDGYFWFGGTNGINVFKPSEVKKFPFAPRPHITDILVNNAPYRPDTSIIEKKRLVLPYDSNTVRLDFTAVEFSDAPSDSISYTFNLADLDATKWVWKTTANAAAPSVSYINLREGDYVLRLKAVNSDGVWSETRILELCILPPWHRTWWFYIFVSALGLGITYAVVRKVIAFREKQLKAKAAFEQKIKETELQVLRLQMNPHFIFSALNSIRAYVLNKDSDAASKFLADFAHLMRQILQYSTEESITLEKEEELLRGYLEMEQLRFDFDFDIQIADDLDTFETEVPPMILQPFVENAILHGIASKRDDKGAILVRFDKEDNSVLCSVQDNGLGMGKSLRKKNQDHESKTRAITQDRLDIITQLTGKPTALIYENVETGGTKVTIRLPINLGTLDD